MVIPAKMDASIPLYVAYQPVVRMNRGVPHVAAYESLLRIAPNSAQHTTLSVITNAEQDGSMPVLDARITAQVCAEVAPIEAMRTWVNISQRTLANPIIARDIVTLIDTHNLSSRITLEMTETADGNESLILESLRGLKGKNITVVIDDIDDGHTKSHLLKSDLIAGCKLSRRSTIRMVNDPNRLEATKRLVEWCRSNGKSVVMEGIENEQELALALQLGVDFCQGFYFWAALPLDKLPIPGTRVTIPRALMRHAS
ncbi:EAL domain-containing protein [Pseudomonas tritici]|uniref:EAL domain-containing protein n=1 Tax=Pseudomonas tritici TaxID=2745518 RepID=UPI00387B323C